MRLVIIIAKHVSFVRGKLKIKLHRVKKFVFDYNETIKFEDLISIGVAA